jgi:hypothetical protein
MARDQVEFSLSKTRYLKTLRAVLLPLPPTTITKSYRWRCGGNARRPSNESMTFYGRRVGAQPAPRYTQMSTNL